MGMAMVKIMKRMLLRKIVSSTGSKENNELVILNKKG
jgi:hypothetical protein